MKALILAGGFGTRLRPLSCTRSKLMFPIANTMLLDWILRNLSKEGVTKVVLAVNYLADVLKQEFGSSMHGMELVYSREKTPLGTAGPIKKAEKLLNEDDEPFFVLNGDILSLISYSKLYKVHQLFGGMGTIALHEVADPTRFGVVELGDNDCITRFVEKPKLGEAPSKLVNAGVYVLELPVLDYIPRGKKVSIEREVFPAMTARKQLYGYRFQGLWIDTGKPGDYFLANKFMLDRIAGRKPIISGEANVSSKVKIIPPVIIEKDVVIDEDACVGPYVSLGKQVTVGKGTKIHNAIIFPKAWIDCHTSINGAIVGEAATIGRWVKVEDHCIIGDHVVIEDNVTLTKNIRICPNKKITDSIWQSSIII